MKCTCGGRIKFINIDDNLNFYRYECQKCGLVLLTNSPPKLLKILSKAQEAVK